jgi:hypothetical protein
LGERVRFEKAKIVCINARGLVLAEFVMTRLFDVSKETILVTGASQGLGRQFAFLLT